MPNYFPHLSLKTRATLLTLVIFLAGMWSLAFYAGRILREDMQQLLGEQQFSTVSLLGAQVNNELTMRLRVLEQYTVARITPAIRDNAMAMQTLLEGSPTI